MQTREIMYFSLGVICRVNTAEYPPYKKDYAIALANDKRSGGILSFDVFLTQKLVKGRFFLSDTAEIFPFFSLPV